MANEIKRKIKIENDSAALQAALHEIANLEKQLGKVNKELVALEKESKKTSKVIPDVFDDKQVKRAEKSIRQAQDAMQDYGDEASRAAREVEAFGDVGTGLSTVRGALDSAGIGGPVGGALLGGAELADSVEAIRRLQPAIVDVAGKAVGTNDSLVRLSGGLQASSLGLSSTAANFATLGAVAAPVAIAVAAAALAFKDFTNQSQRNAELLAARVQVERDLGQEIATGALTAEEAEARLAELNARLGASQESLRKARLAYDELEEASGALAPILKVVSSEEQVLSDAIKESRQQVETYQAQIDGLTSAIEGGRLASADAAAAEEALAQRRVTNAQSIANVELQLLSAREQSSESIAKQISTIQAQIDIYQQQSLATQNAGGDVAALNQRITELRLLSAKLETETLPLVRAQEAEIAAQEKRKEATERFNEAAQESANTVKRVMQKAAEAAFEQQNKLIVATDAYNKDVEKIQSAAYEKLANLQQKYNDSLIDAAAKLVDDQQAISARLAETISGLGRDAAEATADAQRELGRANVDAQRDLVQANQQAQREFRQARREELLDAQRAEQEAVRDHLQRLKKIQEDSQAEEEDAATNRNFRRLFEIRKQTSRELEAASEEFNTEQQDRQRQLGERLADLASAHVNEQQERQREYQQRLQEIAEQFQRERQDRQREYQQRLQEAQQQAAQERQEAQRAYSEQLINLRNKHMKEQQEIQTARDKELQSRRKAIEDELRLISQGHDQRLQAERKFNDRLLKQAQQILTQLSTTSNAASRTPVSNLTSQNGGAALAGIGRTIYNAINNRNSATLNQNVQVSTPNPADAAAQIRDVVGNFISEIFN